MKTFILTSFCCALLFVSQAQIVNIPDANFKAYLVGNTAINTNADTEIQLAEASGYTGVINCSLMNITDLTGISVFSNISELNCSNNQLTSLDLTSNVMMGTLTCFNNLSLSSLNINGLPGLEYLYCSSSGLNTLDVSTNIYLKVLNCGANNLASLDVSANTALLGLNCSNNALSSIDVSNNNALTSLNIEGNAISSLTLTNNTSLTSLDCQWNNLSALNVSNLPNLGILRCNNNVGLTSLDVSNNPALYLLHCQSNQLTSLNVANGNNANFSGFNATQNQLTCIQVDNVAWSTSNWTSIDPGASFNTNCGLGLAENEINLSAYPNPVNNQLFIESKTASQINIINAQGTAVLQYSLHMGSNSVSVEQLSAGIYMIQTPNGFTKKFVKE